MLHALLVLSSFQLSAFLELVLVHFGPSLLQRAAHEANRLRKAACRTAGQEPRGGPTTQHQWRGGECRSGTGSWRSGSTSPRRPMRRGRPPLQID
jgi:hypothetical protein